MRVIGADRELDSGAQLKGCEDRGMDVYVPIRKQLGRRGKGDRFGSDDFRYDPQDDTYVCPVSVRPGSGWPEATRPSSSMTSCMSFIARRQRLAGVVRCRADAWKRRTEGAG